MASFAQEGSVVSYAREKGDGCAVGPADGPVMTQSLLRTLASWQLSSARLV